MKKNILVKVQTPAGERHLTYHPVNIDKEDENLCDTKCPYGKNRLCDKLRDPRDPENKNACFMAFCQEIDPNTDLVTPDKNILMNNYIPVDMTIEDNLSDVADVYKDIIRVNPCVRITRVIDTICPDWCPDYCADHSNCTSKNMSCIMRGLLEEVETEQQIAQDEEDARTAATMGETEKVEETTTDGGSH
jgi:hypothetical protein